MSVMQNLLLITKKISLAAKAAGFIAALLINAINNGTRIANAGGPVLFLQTNTGHQTVLILGNPIHAMKSKMTAINQAKNSAGSRHK